MHVNAEVILQNRRVLQIDLINFNVNVQTNTRLKQLPTISRFYQNLEEHILKMFKYFQRFLFTETNSYLFKAFKEEEFDVKGWVHNIKSLLVMIGLGNCDKTYIIL